MKRAFFVLGPENGGTKMLTGAFLDWGCYGSAEHHQPWDDFSFPPAEHDIVFRRSIPHGGNPVDLWRVAKELKDCGYEVVPVYIHRKTDFVVAGQLRTDREEEGKVQAPYSRDAFEAWEHITGGLEMCYEFAARCLKTPLIVVPYENFVTEGVVRHDFFRCFGLERVKSEMEFYNANEHERYSEVKALPW